LTTYDEEVETEDVTTCVVVAVTVTGSFEAVTVTVMVEALPLLPIVDT